MSRPPGLFRAFPPGKGGAAIPGARWHIFGSEPDEQLQLALPHVLALIIGALDGAGCACLVLYTLLSPRDPATAGLGIGFAWVIVLLFAATAVPALLLTRRERAPRTALGLALAFPLGFMVLYAGLELAAWLR